MKEVGSRNYNFIDYKGICILSGVDFNLPAFLFKGDHTIILRSDLVMYCHGYLAYKFGILEDHDVALLWSKDSWKYPNNKVYRETFYQDLNSVKETLKKFEQNFMRSDAKKISY